MDPTVESHRKICVTAASIVNCLCGHRICLGKKIDFQCIRFVVHDLYVHLGVHCPCGRRICLGKKLTYSTLGLWYMVHTFIECFSSGTLSLQ